MKFKPTVDISGNGVASRKSSDYLKDPKVLDRLNEECRHYDCGFCYAPNTVKTNAVNGACNKPSGCPFYSQSGNKVLTKEGRAIAQMETQIEMLTAQCLELQRENAELRHAHKKAFAILREAH